MKYCEHCKRKVVPERKKFNWIIFLLGLLSFGVVSLIYLVIYLLRSKKYCSLCRAKVISIKKAKKLGLLPEQSDDF